MNEQEWLASTDPAAMLRLLQNPPSQAWDSPRSPWFDRKLRLFACACCRQVWHLLTDDSPCPDCDKRGGIGFGHRCQICSGSGRINRSRWAVEVAERFADGLATQAELDDEYNTASTAFESTIEEERDELQLRNLVHICTRKANNIAVAHRSKRLIPATVQADLLRHIVGNPWRPRIIAQAEKDKRALKEYQILDINCLTPLVLDLAGQLYSGDDCAFALHDALLDAGAPDELVEHFNLGVHPKGCWALDAILNLS